MLPFLEEAFGAERATILQSGRGNFGSPAKTNVAPQGSLRPSITTTDAASVDPDISAVNNLGELEQFYSLTIEAVDTETLLATKIAAERDKDIFDSARGPWMSADQYSPLITK